MRNVAVIVGSLAHSSIDRGLARALAHLAGPTLKLEEVSLEDIPLLNSEFQNDPPPVWRMKKEIEAASPVLLRFQGALADVISAMSSADLTQWMQGEYFAGCEVRRNSDGLLWHSYGTLAASKPHQMTRLTSRK